MRFGSLFSGVGGFDLGFEQAGLECAWQVEIDKDCKRVLRRHWPNIELFDDIRTIGKLSDVDVLCGGFPCQDLSVAGKRKGLAGERSGLWFEFLRIAERNKPRWLVIENVPGLLSSWSPIEPPPDAVEGSEWDVEENSDLEIILTGLSELGYGVAYRVFDAQYFNLAQRRERVFIVGSLGDGSCAEILFESEGVSGDSPPSREARAGIAPTVRGGTASGSNEFGNKVAATLDQRGRGPTDSVMMNLQISGSVTSKWAKGGGPAGDEAYNLVTVSAGHDTGQGWWNEAEIAGTLRAEGENRPSRPSNIVAFSSKDCGADAGHISPTLRAQNFKDSHINGGGQVAIAFTLHGSDKTVNTASETDLAGSVRTKAPGSIENSSTTVVAFHENKSGQLSETDVLGLRSGASHSYQGVGGNFGVRRLTPRECERLQGFPDDWTRYDSEGKEISDSARYRMLGNAVAVPNAKWIGERILDNPRTQGSDQVSAARGLQHKTEFVEEIKK